MNRSHEVEVLPACGYYGMGVVPYSPLASGVLTGKHEPKASRAKGTLAGCGDQRILQTESRKASLVFAQRIKKHAEKRGMTAGAFAALWVLNNKSGTSLLAGPQTMLAPVHSSTPGYNDLQYGIEGRPTLTG